jgi:D-alanyl-lipoteichoic acid acyltransferase DltB (MBOAT superfamily)
MFLRRNRSRRNLANFIIPPMVTMLASGLWHGFSGHMLLWGGLHGLYQIIGRVPSLWRPTTPPQRQPRWRQVLAATVVFALVMFAWVPFRWELSEAFEFWKGLLNWSSFAIRYRRMFLVAPLIVGVVGLDWIQYHYRDEFIFLRWPRLAQAFCLAVILLFVFIFTGSEGVGVPFVYQGF